MGRARGHRQVLKEQKPQAAFGPQGVGERVANAPSAAVPDGPGDEDAIRAIRADDAGKR